MSLSFFLLILNNVEGLREQGGNYDFSDFAAFAKLEGHNAEDDNSGEESDDEEGDEDVEDEADEDSDEELVDME